MNRTGGKQDTTARDRDLPARDPVTVGRAADLFLEIASVLLMADAHCGRVNRNVARVAGTWATA